MRKGLRQFCNDIADGIGIGVIACPAPVFCETVSYAVDIAAESITDFHLLDPTGAATAAERMPRRCGPIVTPSMFYGTP